MVVARSHRCPGCVWVRGPSSKARVWREATNGSGLRTRFKMKLRRQGAMGECEARTQEALVAALRVRPRTMHRAAQCALGGRSFILNRVVSSFGNSRPSSGHYFNMSTSSDRELWNRALAGDASAFGELFDRHATSVYNYVFRRCGNWATAEDLTSLVFLETWRKPRKVQLVHDSALPYLLGVATNVLRNRSRTERRYSSALARLAALADAESPSEEVGDRLAEEQRMKDILLVLGRLPQRQQDAIVLCIWMGLTYEEAAVALRLPVGTVRSRLSRGKRRLRELLEGCGYSAAGFPEQRVGQDVAT